MFVNDLEDILKGQGSNVELENLSLRMLMFADDTVVVSESREGIQKGLDFLEEYCDNWGITINVEKTKALVFTRGGRFSKLDTWTYKGNKIETVTVFKYLGFHLASSGSFSQGIQERLNSGRRALFGLRKMFNTNSEILPYTKIEMCRTVVCPVLSYCCEVWGLARADPIEKFYLSFLRSVLHVKTSTPKSFLYGELGVYPLIIERKIRVVKYWLKLIRPATEQQTYAHAIYKELYCISQSCPKKITWATLVRDMLETCGLGHFWYAQFVENEDAFISLLKQRLSDIFVQEWWQEIDKTSNNRLYKHIKEHFGYEMYLNMCCQDIRMFLTRVRLSSHSFNVERGRWGRKKIEYAERKCRLCECVEDEYHCLVECPMFSEERKTCLPVSLIRRPSMFEFVKFMKSNRYEDCVSAAILCKRVMNAYKRKM